MRDIQLKLLTILRHNLISSSLLGGTMIFAKCFGSLRARLTKLCCMVAMLISNQYSISSCHWLSDIGAWAPKAIDFRARSERELTPAGIASLATSLMALIVQLSRCMLGWLEDMFPRSSRLPNLVHWSLPPRFGLQTCSRHAQAKGDAGSSW